MKPVAALAVGAMALWAQTGKPAPHSVTAVRHWSLGSVTRIAIEVSGEFEYRSDQLHDPERVYYDIRNSRPKFDNKRLYTEDLDDAFVKRIRVAETAPGVTRVVLDLSGAVEATASVLSSPDRLIIELRSAGQPTDPAAAPAIPGPTPVAPPTTAPATTSSVMTTTAVRGPVSVSATPSAPPPPVVPPSLTAPPSLPTPPIQVKLDAAPTPAPEAPAADTSTAVATVKPDAAKAVQPPAEMAKPAHHTSAGSTSLVRALGLKIQRVVIDPGHGGHDEGTQGPKGLLEKDLVLDVALRVGKLIEDRMGAEVIYTRSDDTFVPLEGRTALANDKKADLFLSIHANSSPTQHVTGVETYYLNFTDSKDALDVASRENASSQKSVFELRDLIERISAHDKAEESRDFASRIQTALFAFSSKTFPAEKNRGVRKAPFVVLIGANMPSVLAEIGFLSNPREELLLKKPDYRQKLAESLYRGISKYAEGLSHFQVAEN
jgi:N-acetylmuramoyl-L-alanine amidase